MPESGSGWKIALGLLGDIWQFIKKNWSGVALLFWNYEERKQDKLRSEKEATELDAQEQKNKLETIEKYLGEPDDVVLRQFAGPGGSESDPQSDPKSGASRR